jgi:tetratricopeptide (TPR) repeat protein
MWKALRELPLTILHLVSEGLERLVAKTLSPFRNDEEEESDGKRRSWTKRVLLLPMAGLYWLFRGALWAISLPVRGFFFPARQRACYLRGLPASILAVLLLVGAITHLYYREAFVQRYISKVTDTFSAKAEGKSVLFAKRLVSYARKPRRENLYLYGVAYARADQMEVAQEAMALIAPDDKIGFAPAHLFRATELVLQLQGSQQQPSEPNEEMLDQLEWHLEQSGGRDEERRWALWARLHQARGELNEAAEALEKAGAFQPSYLLSLADMEEKRNKTAAANRALERARDGFIELLRKRPEDKLARLQFVVVLTKLKQLPDAEKILLAGLQLHRDPQMQRATAEFYTLQFDDCPRETSFVDRFSYLARAMTIDLNYREIYVRLARLFSPDLPKEEVASLKSIFEQLLVSGPNPAAAHFAIGFLDALSLESRPSAAWHLAQAQTLQPAVAIAYINLAKVLVSPDSGRLEEAELFARQSIAGEIQQPVLYATVGQVFNAKSDWKSTIEILEKAAETYPDSGPLHTVLAEAYLGNGDEERAAMHRQLASELDAKSKTETPSPTTSPAPEIASPQEQPAPTPE